MLIFYIISSVFTAVVFFNYLIYKSILRSALRKFINPFLKSKNLILKKTAFTGFFNKGDFGHAELIVLPIPEIGKILTSTYVYIFAMNEEGDVKRYTAKIMCQFLFIKKVLIKAGSIVEVLRK